MSIVNGLNDKTPFSRDHVDGNPKFPLPLYESGNANAPTFPPQWREWPGAQVLEVPIDVASHRTRRDPFLMSNLPDGPDHPSVVWYIRTLLDEQKAATQVARSTLERAAKAIESISFPLGYASKFFDQPSVVGMLRDMRPDVAIDVWQQRARELAMTP